MRWWLPLAGLAVLLVLVPVVAVVEVPGERDVKELLGVDQGEQCGPIVGKGDPGTWRREAPTPTLRDGPAGVVIGDGAYLVGGIVDFEDDGVTADSVDTVERFDFGTRRWETLPPLPRQLNHVSVATWRGDLYVVGGLVDDRQSGTANLWRFDTAARRWEELPSMPTARGAGGAVVAGDRLYVVGGLSGESWAPQLEAFDLRTQRWEQLPSMEVERDHLGAVHLDGILYVLGGRHRDQRPLRDFEAYDMRTGTWERLPDLPEATAGFGFEVVGDRLIAAGGEDLSERILTGRVWSYDPAAREWTPLPGMSRPKHGFAMVEYEDRLWAFSGSRCSGFFPVRGVDSWKPPA
jgi:Kelch motif